MPRHECKELRHNELLTSCKSLTLVGKPF